VTIKLIGVDIDGTLLDSRHELSPANAQALAEAAGRGIEVVLVTGRRFDFALPIAQQIPCPLTLIVNNGALIKSKDGTTHVRHLLPVRTARAVLAATLPFRAGAAVVFDRPRANQVIWEVIAWNDPGRRSYFERNREFIAQMPLEDSLTEDPIQVMFTGGVREMREVAKILRACQGGPEAKQFALAYTEYEARDFALVDVIHAACSKGAALAEWTRLRGLEPGQVMAIGDNHNDVEMLEFAGLAVIMGNSVPELRRDGWHVTTSNDEDGVAEAVRRFALPSR
jgi:Cof subfamily protein (haloacid dehalogenase superfamily)